VTVNENQCLVTAKDMKKEYLARKGVFINNVLNRVEGVKTVKFEETFEKPVIELEE
jgi:hypothetical protein